MGKIIIEKKVLLALLCYAVLSGALSHGAFEFFKERFEAIPTEAKAIIDRAKAEEVQNKKTEPDTEESDVSEDIDAFEKSQECKAKYPMEDWDINCQQDQQTTAETQKQKTLPPEDCSVPVTVTSEDGKMRCRLKLVVEQNVVIKLIIFALKAGLAIELFLGFYFYAPYCHPEKFPIFRKYVAFHLSDWAINTPPILGVLTNLIMFAIALVVSEDNIQKVLRIFFFEAIVITLIGGVFYTISLALKTAIHPKIERLK